MENIIIRMGNITIKRSLLLAMIAGFNLTVFNTQVSAEEVFVPICENRDAVIAGLANEYFEAPVSMGYTAQGTVIEILASAKGDWTMIETSSDGTTCLVANGEMWQGANDLLKTSANAETLFY
jgi:hypothetical protein